MQNRSGGHDADEYSGVSMGVLNVLELLDNVAHVIIAIFFIVLAASVVIYASALLVRDLPLMFQSPESAAVRTVGDGSESAPPKTVRPAGNSGAHSEPGTSSVRPGRSGESTTAAPGESPAPTERAGVVVPDAARGADAIARSAPETAQHAPNLFLHSSLELLSTLLFAVIVLELLKTIITYLKTHNIQAIMKEFLVVGIISSIRKILLVGAEASLGSADPTAAYIKEATGTVITIVGILLLITGLIFLQRTENGAQKHSNA